MIIEYHRPETLEQAKRLLNRDNPVSVPLGGGFSVSRYSEKPIAVVDLQSLGLNKISIDGTRCRIGSMVRLQDLVESKVIPSGLSKAAKRETNINLRRTGSIGGLLISADGTSPLLGALLALDARITWEPGNKTISLDEWLEKDRGKKPGLLITELDFIVPVEMKYEDVARSPEDKPIVYVIVSRLESGETRVVTGGAGKFPLVLQESSKNVVKELIGRFTRTELKEQPVYTDYQKEAINILVDRMLPSNGAAVGKGL